MGVSAPLRTILVHEYVTGGGLAGSALPASWAAEGGAMRRAVAEDFASLEVVRVVMTLDARLPDEPGPWTTVRVGPGQEPETFARLAAEADDTLCIAPETDGVLVERARTIERVGGRSLGASPWAIDLTGNKLLMNLHWNDERISTPRTESIRVGTPWPDSLTFHVHLGSSFRSGPPRRHGDPVIRTVKETHPYPAVLKPIDGAGSVHTYLVASAHAPWPEECRALDRMLLQPYETGLPMSASVLIGGDGRMTLVGIGRQRVEVRDGRFHYLGGTVPARPEPPAAEVIRALGSVEGLRGWVGLDFLWDEATGRVSVLEINPRLTTSYIGWRRLLPAGELARIWLAALDGRVEDEGASLAGRVGARGPVCFDADGTVRAEDERC